MGHYDYKMKKPNILWKNPKKTDKTRKNPKKPEKTHVGLGFFKKTHFFVSPDYNIHIRTSVSSSSIR